MTEHKHTVLRLAALFRPHRAALVLAMAMLTVSSAMMTLGPWLVRRAIDVDIARRDTRGLVRTAALILVVQLGNLVVAYAVRILIEGVGQRMLASLKVRLVDHMLRLPMSFYDRNAPGKLMSRVQNDTQALRAIFSATALTLAGDGLLFVFMLAVMAQASPRLTAVTLLVLPAVVAVSVFFHRRTHPIFLELRGLTAEVCARLAELLAGMPVVRAFERRAHAAEEFRALNARKFGVQLRGDRLFVVWFHTLALLQSLAIAAILAAGGAWALAGAVSIGTLAMFMGYVRRLFEPLFHVSEQLAEMQRALSAAERIFQLLDEPELIAEPSAPAAWRGVGEGIRFEHVWFRYGEDQPWALEDVSFTLPAGEAWAVVGPTGSGKSTLAALLLRFYEPQRGRILVGGVDVRELPQRELRRHVGLVPQDIGLFPDTLRSNLTMGRPVADEVLAESAALARSRAVIARLPGGLEGVLAENGAGLSMGERQLLSFTRALVARPEVLVLDEATSAIDPATEAMVAQGLKRLLDGRTALVIAHRLATVEDCHRLLVLHHGRIVEEGEPGALYQKGGMYRTLVDLQRREKGHAAHVPS